MSPGAALSPALQRHPRPAQWLRFGPAGRLEVRTGKVELGQGLHHTLAMIVADELGWPLAQLDVSAPSTASHPDEGVTSGSLSVQDSGTALRCMAATLRERLCEAAARAWGVPAPVVVLDEGWLAGPGGRRQPAGGFVTEALLEAPVETWPPFKPAPARRVVGRATGGEAGREALRAVFAGAAHFIHDLTLPGLLHGRVVHPPALGDLPVVEPAALAALAQAQALPGVVQAWLDGALLGVVAASPAQADAAAALLAGRLQWGDAPCDSAPQRVDAACPLVDPVDPHAWPPAAAPARLVAQQSAAAGAEAAPGPGRRLTARYSRSWIAHASVGPSCALARWAADGGGLEVWTHSQGIFGLRRDLALAFGLDEAAVVVHHAPGAGCYGHNGADDVAFDAAWLARRVPGWPLRLLWSRADEMARAPLGPAMLVELQATLDEAGAITAWRHALWSPGHSSRPGRSAAPSLLGNAQRAGGRPLPEAIDMPLAVGGGAERNAIPGYALPTWQVWAHRVVTPWRSSALRSLGAFGNVFAAESFIDEIAQATSRCPLALRRSLLAHDPRGLAVLQAAARRAGWGEGAANARPAAEGRGRGLGYARYKGTGAWCAVVAEVEAGAVLAVRRLTIAVDVGLAVHPDGVVQQIEGGAIQAVSWALKEAVAADAAGRIATTGWDDYPILRFGEIPEIDVVCLPSDEPALGAGEAALGPTAAAIANALFDALGVRVRDLPLTPARIVAAIEASA